VSHRGPPRQTKIGSPLLFDRAAHDFSSSARQLSFENNTAPEQTREACLQEKLAPGRTGKVCLKKLLKSRQGKCVSKPLLSKRNRPQNKNPFHESERLNESQSFQNRSSSRRGVSRSHVSFSGRSAEPAGSRQRGHAHGPRRSAGCAARGRAFGRRKEFN
jgi:hypothetical protein